jgi:hypothetical protein
LSTMARAVHKLSIGAMNWQKRALTAGITAIAGGTKINTAGVPTTIGVITITTSTDAPEGSWSTLPKGGCGSIRTLSRQAQSFEERHTVGAALKD